MNLKYEPNERFDFEEENAFECMLSYDYIKSLERKINKFLIEYPENPLLTKLQDIINRILSMPIETALKTVLNGLELLIYKGHVFFNLNILICI